MSEKPKQSKPRELDLKDLGLDEPVKLPRTSNEPEKVSPPKIERPDQPKAVEAHPAPSPALTRNAPPASTPNAPQQTGKSVGRLWVPLAQQYLYYGCVVGLKGTWVATLALRSDTTVLSGDDRIYNYGLLAEQITLLVAGAALSICGAIWLVIGSLLMVAASAQISKEGGARQGQSGWWPVIVTVIVSLVIVVFGSYAILGWSILVLATATILCLYRSTSSV